MTVSTYREALQQAHREALQSDPRVFLMGEDVGKYGGTYAVSMHLLDAFGRDRVRDTPLSESSFVGAGIGAAIAGLRPIVEVMTINFSLLAMDQIVNSAAALRHMSGGQVSVPLVIRMATGAGRQLGAQHSHSLENWFAHVPGLKVVAPATIEDFRWMLPAALADPDPVIIVEHCMLYALEAELSSQGGPVRLDRAEITRPGRDVSIVTYGGSLPKAIAAASKLAEINIEAEVLNLRSLRPLDEAALLESVRKTHRAVIVDEGWRSGGLASEIAARISELAFFDLDAPVRRICTSEVPIPYARHLEEAALPKVQDIIECCQQLVQPHD